MYTAAIRSNPGHCKPSNRLLTAPQVRSYTAQLLLLSQLLRVVIQKTPVSVLPIVSAAAALSITAILGGAITSLFVVAPPCILCALIAVAADALSACTA